MTLLCLLALIVGAALIPSEPAPPILDWPPVRRQRESERTGP